MSLINEALKKAQRLRTDESADPSYPAMGAAVTRRGKPHSANLMVLIATGALVLVVLSVVFTVYLVNRPATTAEAAVATSIPAVQPTPAAPSVGAPATPAIVVPTITPATTPSDASASVAAAPGPAPAATLTPASPLSETNTVASVTPPAAAPTAPAVPAAASAVPAAAAATALTPPATPAPGDPDERVAAFVDTIRVTGIRSSGAESRVLMNERVYRVNDVVERTLGVRLVKAAADSLTFSDPRGVTYEKQF